MDLLLKDKKILVTGADDDYAGSQVVKDLLNEGSIVYALGEKPVEKTSLKDSSGNKNLIYKNINHIENLVDYSKEFMDSYFIGKLDGIAFCHEKRGRDKIKEGKNIVTYNSLDDFFKTNVYSTILMMENFKDKISGGGSVVMLGTIESKLAAGFTIGYASSKSALLGVLNNYAMQLGERQIRVNMVSKGNILTKEKLALLEKNPATMDLTNRFGGRAALSRNLVPEEVSFQIVNLLSPRNSGITGQDILIDAGFSIALYDKGSWPMDAIEGYRRKDS
ncbi:MAG TPA: SDR family oxidoreductase [Alphaproteobacteria bacterium]|nr:SDR family oxidoreductase [Alphaproteobacteria bacterium]